MKMLSLVEDGLKDAVDLQVSMRWIVEFYEATVNMYWYQILFQALILVIFKDMNI